MKSTTSTLPHLTSLTVATLLPAWIKGPLTVPAVYKLYRLSADLVWPCLSGLHPGDG